MNGIAASGAFVSVNVCAVFVGWNWPVFTATGTEVGIGTPNLTLAPGVMITNASKPEDLAKGFWNVGASVADDGLGVGDDYSWGHNECGDYIWTDELTVGFMGEPGFEAHVSASYTKVFNPFGVK